MKIRLLLSCLFIILALQSVIFAETKEFILNEGASKVISLPDIVRVSTSNPEVLEIVVTGGGELLFNAKKTGFSMVNIWTDQGITSYRIIVREDYSGVEKELSGLLNNDQIRVTVNQKSVILNGLAQTSLEADQAVQYAKMYREYVINNLDVKIKYQILLSIIVTEMKKESQNKYGFRWGSWVKTESGVVFNDWQWGFMENGNGHIAHYPNNWGIGPMLEAMQKDGDAKILAAPSILTTSGKEASFLAGGEIPIPLNDGQGGVKVEWKEYGTKLKVTASITKDLAVTLQVEPEVSTLDWANAIMVGGDKLPALSTRKTSTNLTFKEGSTLVIGGLLKKEDSVNVVKLPFLGSLPVVGALFRSKDFQKGNTELLFLVTPRVIKDDSDIDSGLLLQPANPGPFFDTTNNKDGQ